jgi:hypothetical protein
LVKRENAARHSRFETERTFTDFGRVVAIFIAVYGSECFDAGNINWHYFQFLSSHTLAVESYKQVQMAQAMTLAGGILMNGKESMPQMIKLVNQIYD